MNRYTQDFHNAEFPGLKVAKPISEIAQDFWYSKHIPFVEVDLNFDYVPTYDWLLKNNYLFSEVKSQKQEKIKQARYNQEWFAVTRSCGWTGIHVKGSTIKKRDIVSGAEESYDAEVPKFEDAVPDLVKCFENNNIPLKLLQIFRLSPGGWLQPHKDVVPSDTAGLAQFWMPLHDFPQSLKVYPYGYVPHKVGNLYLFNNPNFFHSVINQTSQDRYVAFGTVDHMSFSKETTDHIQNLLISQWS